MIKKETYIDSKGRERKDLVLIYSDLGVRLYQEDTGIMYEDSVIDSIHAHHTYREMVEDLGDIPEEQIESPEEDIDSENEALLDEVRRFEA